MRDMCGLKTLGELEHTVLHVVWHREASGEKGTTIRETFMEACANRDYLAYTTIATTFRRLEAKGWLKQLKSDRQYLCYRTTRSREEVGRAILRWPVQEFFDGDPAKSVMATGGSGGGLSIR